MLDTLKSLAQYFDADDIAAMTKVIDELCTEKPARELLGDLPEDEIRSTICRFVIENRGSAALPPNELKAAVLAAIRAARPGPADKPHTDGKASGLDIVMGMTRAPSRTMPTANQKRQKLDEADEVVKAEERVRVEANAAKTARLRNARLIAEAAVPPKARPKRKPKA